MHHLYLIYNIIHTLAFVFIGSSVLGKTPDQFHKATQTSSFQLRAQAKLFLKVPLLKGETALVMIRVQCRVNTSG